MSASLQCPVCSHQWETPLTAATCPGCGAAVPSEELMRALMQRLAALETRLASLETDIASKFASVPVARIIPAPLSAATSSASLPSQPKAEEKAQQALQTWMKEYKQRAGKAAAPRQTRARPAEAKPTAAPVDPLAVERKIGLQWAAWLGAIIFVLGVGLGIKFALDNGWLQFISPAVRIFLLALGGLALVAAGEWVYRRVQPLAAVGLFGAGIAVLFFAGFAGNLFYELYSIDLAFMATAIVALIGSLVAWRSGFVAVGILAQLGGNLAPILLASNQKPDLPFFAYLYLLEVFALLLAWWGAERKWWSVRLLSFGTTLLWIHLCLDSRGAELAWADSLFWFMLLAMVTFHAEYLRSALQAEVVREADAPRLREIAQAGGTYLLAVTLAAAYFGLQVLEPVSSPQQGLYVGQLAVGTSLVGLLLWRTGLLVPLAMARNYGLQTITLLVLIIPVVLEGPWVSLGWMLLGLAFTAWGAWQAFGVACWAGVSSWLLSIINLGQLVLFAAPTDPLLATWATVLGAPLTTWFLCGLLEAAGGLLLAVLLQSRRLWRVRVALPFLQVSRYNAGMAVGLAVVTSLLGLPLLGSTLALLVLTGVLLGTRTVAPRLRLELSVLVVVLMAVVKWLALDGLVELKAVAAHPRERVFLVNRYFGIGLLAAGTLLGSLYLCRDRLRMYLRSSGLSSGTFATATPPLAVLVWVLAVLLTTGLSVELLRGLGQLRAQGLGSSWPPAWEERFALFMLWSVLLAVLEQVLRRVQASTLLVWNLLGILAGAWVLIGAGIQRLDAASPPGIRVLFNLQFLSAAVVVAAIGWLRWRQQQAGRLDPPWVLMAATVVMLAAGTLEVDRSLPATLAAGGLPITAKHAGISVFWSLFAVGAVAVGFWQRFTWLRYMGLGLFAITLAKVGLVDLSGVAYGYRIISLLVLGLLLLGTSVLYGFLSPRLLAAGQEARPEAPTSAGSNAPRA